MAIVRLAFSPSPIRSRQRTPEAIDALHALGLKIIMLTGDNRTHRRSRRAQARHRRSRSRSRAAATKIEIVQQLAEAGRQSWRWPATASTTRPRWPQPMSASPWAPAPMSRWKAPGITLVKGDLRGIAKAIHLSRAMMRNIRQNLFFAFIYNALGVPIAAGLLYPFFGTLAQPHDRRRGHELQFRLGHRQRAALARSKVMIRVRHGLLPRLRQILCYKFSMLSRFAIVCSIGAALLQASVAAPTVPCCSHPDSHADSHQASLSDGGCGAMTCCVISDRTAEKPITPAPSANELSSFPPPVCLVSPIDFHTSPQVTRVARAHPVAHSPPPLALSCIFLI